MSVYANKMSVDSKVELRLSALSIGRILAPAETELKNFLYLSYTPGTLPLRSLDRDYLET